MEKVHFEHSKNNRTAFDRQLVDFLKESIERCEGEIWRDNNDLIICIPNWANDAKKFLSSTSTPTLEGLDNRLKKLEKKC